MEKIKVLLVDDDLDFGNTAVLLLKKAGDRKSVGRERVC